MFCCFCGHGPVKATAVQDVYLCDICKADFGIVRYKNPQITLEEAQAIFDKIPLTDKKAVQAQKRRVQKK
jgi:hypothetical protein